MFIFTIICTFLNELTPSAFVYGPIFVAIHIFLWSQWKYSVSLSAAVLLSICLPKSIWTFTFTAKSDCAITFTIKINICLSVTGIITITVILLRMVWDCATSFVVCQSVCLFFCIFERYTLHIIIMLNRTYTSFLWGLEFQSLMGSSRNRSWKMLNFKGV